jgi:hypothetical protein
MIERRDNVERRQRHDRRVLQGAGVVAAEADNRQDERRNTGWLAGERRRDKRSPAREQESQ